MRDTNEIFRELKKIWPGVTGVGTSRKIKGGVKTDIPCITVFVAKKKKLSELKPSEVIPTEIDGMVTDVIQAKFKALGCLPAKQKIKSGWVLGGDRTAKWRPAPGGVSVGHPDITAGTLGGWVYKEGKFYILSNNHVLANCNEAEIGDSIYQPGVYDGGTEADKIAELSDYVTLDFSGGNNEVDCAIAEALDLDDVDVQIADLTSKVKYITNAVLGMPTTKSGRTSGITEGPVDLTNLTVEVGYAGGKVATFIHQIGIATDNYLAAGDSGSWMLQKVGGEPDTVIGLLFAGTAQGWGIANPISSVFAALDIALIGEGAAYGSCLTFTTKPEAPTNPSATAISDTRINLSWTKGVGAVNTVIRRKVGSYPTNVTDGEEAYDGPSASFSDTGLTPSTAYYYRAWSYTDPHYSDGYAEDNATTQAGPPGILPPTPTTESANEISQAEATLNGVLANDGGEACDCWFEYAVLGDTFHATDIQSGKTTGAIVSAALADLTPDTRYHFRAIARNSTGITYGNNMYFVTESPALLEYSLMQPELVQLMR